VAILPIPVDRLLVPAAPPALPDAFARVRQSLERGLPATFRLDPELALALYVPTGDAVRWRDARGDETVVAAADDDLAAPTGATDPVARAPVRLVLLRAGQIAAAVPLVPGPPRRLPNGGDGGGAGGALIELAVLDFRIHAGNLRQAGDYGSFIDLAWRRIDRGADRFALPRLPPRVAARFAGLFESEIGEPGGGGEHP
jgi:hypothetical protein